MSAFSFTCVSMSIKNANDLKMQQFEWKPFYRPPLNLHSHFKLNVRKPGVTQCSRNLACFLLSQAYDENKIYFSSHK